MGGFNVVGATQIGLELFGGLVTEEPPENIPQGASPDNQDVVFRPGAVGARPPLKKVLATPLGSVTITYAKSYVQNDGTVINLYLDSAGNLWKDTGTPSSIGSVTPGSYAKSCTAFGREYIAISDGLYGTDVALQFDGTNLDRVTQDGPGIAPTVASTILAPSTISALSRTSNVITVTTSAPHNFKVGYLAQISGVGAEPIGFITTIVINDTDNPGIATVTMASPHGLSPEMFVSIQAPPPVAIGGGINASKIVGDVLTIDTMTPHNLEPGALVTIAGITGGTAGSLLAADFTATLTVTGINTPDQFICIIANSSAVNGTAGAVGTVSLNWPPSGNPETDFWEVLECPSSTVFTVAITYTNGTWPGGGSGVFHPFDGSFFVTSVPSNVTFTYDNQGPSGGAAIIVGGEMASPQGQVAPGTHLCQVAFLTRQGYITTPSPPVKFIAYGDQYLTVADIPIGPPNVVARILTFTGADGSEFFYIPEPAQINGTFVSTATQINDNSTTTVVLDFSDNTLFSALGINIPGNNLPAQITIDGALGFGFFNERLITWGQRNAVTNLLNMGFDGGSCSRQAVTGWTGTGSLTAGHFSEGVSGPSIHQSFYLDYSGAPIGQPNTLYIARCWATGSVTVTISSATSGFASSAVITPGTGNWGQGTFGLPTPATIPSDMIITITSGGVVDNVSLLYAEKPYLDDQLLGSYVNNPEAFDGVTGVFGSNEDTRKVMAVGLIRGTLYLVTQDPGGRVHAESGTGLSEPVGWTANEVASNCGTLSTFSLTQSQADSATAAGGEEWMAWASAAGARIFSGDQPWLISMEIYPDWQNMNAAGFQRIWAMNDPTARKIYFGLPFGTHTAPNLIYPVDYKNLDTAYEIAQSPPIHVTFTGKLAARDHARKWTRWNLPMNGAVLLYRGQGGAISPTFLAGNGTAPGAGGFGNLYSLGCGGYVDDDYGQFFPYYVTYAFAAVDLEQAFQLGGARHLLNYLQWEILGTGYLNLSVLVNQLSNTWPITLKLPMRTLPTYDDEWGGGSATGQRFFLKFAPSPT